MRTAIIIVALLLASTAARAAGTGYIDTDRAITECAVGKRAMSELKTQFDACQKKADPAKAKAADADAEKCQKEANSRWGEISQPIRQKVKATIPALAKKRGFSVIMQAASAAWVAPGLDITDDVIKAVDAATEKAVPDAKDAEIERLRAQLKARDEAKGK